MFATLTTPFGGAAGAGMGGGMGGAASMRVQMEMQQLKAAPLLNPAFGMVIKYLDCLNQLMDAIITTSGPQGVKMWLVEVQAFTKQLQKRMMHRVPLTMQEKQAIMSFANYWRQMQGAPFFMSRPEAQLVLIALTEFATRG